MNSKLLYIIWKSVLPQIIWYHFFVVCVDFVFTLGWTGGIICESAKSTCAKVMPTVCIGLAEWENELNVSNEMQCIYAFCKGQSHTYPHTRAQMFVDNWYSIFDMCGMINFVRDVIWSAKTELISKSQLFYSNITYKQLWRKSIFALSQTMPPVHPIVNTYQSQSI